MYSTILLSNTSNKLFIIQLLYFICISFEAGEEKQMEKRRTSSQPVKQVFFFTEKNNQLSKYRVVFSWYSIRGLFVLYLVQLDNKFGEHEKSVRVTSDTAKSNYYFSSAPRTSHGQMHWHIDILTAKSTGDQFFYGAQDESYISIPIVVLI